MKVENRRCKHCGTEYPYQVSGAQLFKANSPMYCVVCATTVSTALNQIQVRFVEDWVDCSDFTKEEAINLCAEYEKNCTVKRIMARMFDYKLEEYSNVQHLKHNGLEYVVTWWVSKPDFSLRVKKWVGV